MKIRTSDLTGVALDWAVAVCGGVSVKLPTAPYVKLLHQVSEHGSYSPSTDWAQGGPIIERERIQIRPMRGVEWDAYNGLYGGEGTSKTPLEAAMRCYVVSKLGKEVEVPDELLTQPTNGHLS